MSGLLIDGREYDGEVFADYYVIFYRVVSCGLQRLQGTIVLGVLYHLPYLLFSHIPVLSVKI